VLLTQAVADVMAPGDHGSTFAGNPLVCHAACAVFDVIADPHFLAEVARKVSAAAAAVAASRPLFGGGRGACGAAAPASRARRRRSLAFLTPDFFFCGRVQGELLRSGLRAALAGCPAVLEVRGTGLICGVQLDRPAGAVVAAARARGVLVITAGKGDVVRLVPPLTVRDEEIAACCAVLGEVARELLLA
jgi:acetylornithine aminotransferase